MKKLFLLCFTAVAFASCATLPNYLQSADDRVKRVEIGMTERQVISIMGNDYEVVEANKNTKVIAYGIYSNAVRVADYRFTFRNGKLQSFDKQRINQRRPHRPHQPDRRNERPR